MSATAPRIEPLPPKFMGDLAQLKPHAHGNRSLTWWGMMGIVAIESTAFTLAAAAYFYIATHSREWPTGPMPSLLPGTIFTIVSTLSALPNAWLKRVAEHEKLKPVQIGLVVMTVIGAVMLVIRCFEFPALNVAWSDSAYGSIAVTMLGLHTVHLATDFVDTVVLTALMFTPHAKGRRFVDVAENAIYWYFVVVAWLPIYALLYFTPRWM
jgi:heme/copper-type cytochrome/quinol oxidase subunit 3